jgi:transcriptional regulator with XRE-family HTH domain
MNQSAQPAALLAQLLQENKSANPIQPESIADALGCSLSVLQMFLSGTTRIPMSALSKLAALLMIDPVSLLRRALAEYMPSTLGVIDAISGHGLLLTQNEQQLIHSYRSTVGTDDRVAVVACARDVIAVVMV